MESKTVSFASLPDEIVQRIILYIPPTSVVALERTSRRFYNIANESLLWRQFYRSTFLYNNPDDNASLNKSWKARFADRYQLDQEITELLNGIITNQIGRIEKTEKIVSFGIEAKDTLLRHLAAGDEADDVLARRYYSGAVLGSLNRSLAIPEWTKLRKNEHVLLERVIGAFDMFVLHDGTMSLSKISEVLDDLSRQLPREHSEWQDMSTRQKALAVASYLRAHKYRGVILESRFRDLNNCFLGIALAEEDHASVPLISVVIYCCIASRLGIDANPCGFPFHVYAVIRPPAKQTLDGHPCGAEKSEKEKMFMDPFRSDEEVPAEDLRSQLDMLGFNHYSFNTYLNKAAMSELVIRCAKNIMISVQSLRQEMVNARNAGRELLLPRFRDINGAFYAALWACVIGGIPLYLDGPYVPEGNPAHILSFLSEHLLYHVPADVFLLEKHLLPLHEGNDEYTQLRRQIRAIRASDMNRKYIHRREEYTQTIKYRVGQVFRHKRYHYQAIIIGWDVQNTVSGPWPWSEPEETAQWFTRSGPYQVQNHKDQTFYQVLIEDSDVRYVAEENLEIIEHADPSKFLSFAGKVFKRWDPEKCVFISNIKSEYPDD